MATLAPSTQTRPLAWQTYERMAPVYDALTAHHDYRDWLGNLLPAAEAHGLRGHRLLDVACGTGRSFEPLLDREWQIAGCDISEAMLERARVRANGQVELVVADMRRLPLLGEFDLVWALGDAVNNLLSPEDLTSAFRAMSRNMAPDGLLLFDTNTLLAYRTFYVEPEVFEIDGQRLRWRGLASATTPPGAQVEGRIEMINERDEVSRCLAVHHQRHFPPDEVLQALADAGLEAVGVYGHGYDARLQQPLDELLHTKAIFIARLQTQGRRR